MAAKKTAVVAGRKVGRRDGHTRVVLYLRLDQLAALVEEARRRADDQGVLRADTSEVAREAVDAWMKRRGRPASQPR